MTMMCFLLAELVLTAQPVPQTPIPVILDTDLGDDIDDTWALGMILGSPQLDLKLVVTASDDTEKKTRLVAKILQQMGRTDIPLGMGIKNSDNPINQSEWLGDYALKDFPGKLHQDGVQALIDTIKAAPGVIPIIVIGPQTNIQEALRRDPSIAQKARIIAMAGSVYIGYNGKNTRDPEWNVVKDVKAAKAVFDAPWDITLCPLDICGQITLKGDKFAAVANSANPRAKTIIENYNKWTNRKHYAAGESSVLFDTVAVYLTLDQSFCTMQTVNLSIDDKGNTVPDEKGRPVHCAVSWKNQDGFEKMLIDSITTNSK